MKFRMIPLLLLSAMLFTGCANGSVERKMDAAEDAIENRVDAVEDRIEQAVTQNSTTAPTAAAPSTAATEAVSALTAEEAEAIALKDANLTREQVTRLRSEYDHDRGIPEYDVEFHSGGWEYDYEIHAETGEILHKETERDD